MSQSLGLPIDVPWSLIAASPDMMDTTFCDDGFPPPWRSSLAIYAYEPSPDDLPQQLCDQRVTYLKGHLLDYRISANAGGRRTSFIRRRARRAHRRQIWRFRFLMCRQTSSRT